MSNIISHYIYKFQASLDPYKKHMVKHTFRITLGIVLVIIGMIGGLIPVFQGWLFGIPGLIILADYFPPINRLLKWAKKKAGYSEKSKDKK